MAKKHKHSRSRARQCEPAIENKQPPLDINAAANLAEELTVERVSCEVTEAPAVEALTEATQPRRMRWFHLAFITALAGLCAILYAWTADFPMVFDDGIYLKNNPLIKDAGSFGYLADFREFANKPGKMGLELDLATNFILRPVAYATFHLNYLLDDFNPRWYRVFNMAAHLGAAALIYALITILLRSSTKSLKLSRTSVTFISATSALLFAVHPLATESVTYIAQRFTSLGTFFYLLTLVLHFTANAVQTRARRWLLRGASIIALILGMLTKEFTFTTPVMAILLDRLLVGTPLKKAMRSGLFLLLCMPIIPVQVMLVSWAQNDGVFSLNHSVNLTNLKDLPWNHWHYAITQLTVVLDYLRSLFFPINQNIDPEWPLYRSLLEAPVLAALATFTFILASTWFLYRRYRHDPRLACLFVFSLWFFGTVIVSSGMVPLPDLKAEHRSYLPSIGIFVAIGCLLDRLRTLRWPARPLRFLIPALALACVAALSITTFRRNEVWRTKVGLWEDTVAKSPGRYRAWNNLGAAYQADSKLERSIECFRKAKEIEPRYEVPYLNTALALNILGRHKEALQELDSLMTVSPKTGRNLDVQYQYGLALLGAGQVDRGMNLLERITEAAPTHRPSHVMVGFIYSRNNMPAKALKYWKQAVALEPASPKLAEMIRDAELALNQ